MIQATELLGEADAGLCRSEALHAAAQARPEECLFFDIETTGLSADTAFIFLIGCIGCEDGKWVLRQFLISRVQEEKELLSSFFGLAKGYRMLVHFNGSSFDLPFVKKRAGANRLETPFDDCLSVDLYQRYRPLKKLLGLEHMNQRTLERFLGRERTDSLTGKEVADSFWGYSAAQDRELGQKLLLHNHDDLLGMLQVLKLEAYAALAGGRILRVCGAAETQDHRFLQIGFALRFPVPLAVAASRKASSDGAYALRAGGQEGSLLVPLFSGTLLYFFPDYKNYFYLPLENQAIHRSVAVWVEKEYRVPARPENCYVPKPGRFLPQPEARFGPALRESYASKELYFEYDEDFCTRTEELEDYVAMLLRHVLQGASGICVQDSEK